MAEEIEIFFDDLKEDIQKEILKAYKITDPADMNWDVFPITSVPYPAEE